MNQGEECATNACAAVPLTSADHCWAHADGPTLESALRRLAIEGRLDARGVTIAEPLLKAILAAAPTGEVQARFVDARLEGARFTGRALFESVTFAGAANFAGVQFDGTAHFSDATFEGPAVFDRAVFREDARFYTVRFSAPAAFGSTSFRRAAQFARAAFEDRTDFTGAKFTGRTRFDKASFAGSSTFAGSTFAQEGYFREASFLGRSEFNSAVFSSAANFGDAGFNGEASFARATLSGHGSFSGTIFTTLASFHDTQFGGPAFFVGGSFRGPVYYERAVFHDAASWESRQFHRSASFEETQFRGNARLDHTKFNEGACFKHAVFAKEAQLGPLVASQALDFDAAVFDERLRLHASAPVLLCRRTRFSKGVQLRLQGAQVVLDDTDISSASILTAVPSSQDLSGDGGEGGPIPEVAPEVARPKLLSVQRADLGGLSVRGVGMEACRFSGAHNLDKLRFEDSRVATAPKGFRWTARHTIAEEHEWRSHRAVGRRGHAGWYPPATQLPEYVDGDSLSAAEVATLYRSLRKGREDNKDDPGAADFYYGEMEMRRHAQAEEARRAWSESRRQAATAAGTEYAVLSAYWLVSGYGLRAWRAFSTLLLLVLMAGCFFALSGFAPPGDPVFRATATTPRGGLVFEEKAGPPATGLHQMPRGILFAAQSTTALLRGPERGLTLMGEWVHLLLRLGGPVLLGLGALALRGRVKR